MLVLINRFYIKKKTKLYNGEKCSFYIQMAWMIVVVIPFVVIEW